MIPELNPVLPIGGQDCAFLAQSSATLTKPELGERVGSLLHYHDELSQALDILLAGF